MSKIRYESDDPGEIRRRERREGIARDLLLMLSKLAAESAGNTVALAGAWTHLAQAAVAGADALRAELDK